MAPVVHALRRKPELSVRFVLTGQHTHLADPIVDFFKLEPDCTLQTMGDGGSNGLLARTLTNLHAEFTESAAQLVLVHGDTTTALGASLAAFHLQIPIGHVEAGLRTGDMTAPFPEEMNRIVIDRMSDLHFAPTPGAVEALRREGLGTADLRSVGNTCIDALLQTVAKLGPLDGRTGERHLILATLHRREGQQGGLGQIARGLVRLAQRGDVRVVLPIHPNPSVAAIMRTELDCVQGVELVPPLAYPDFVDLMRQATLIVTDSGGIQEEAPTFGVPVLVARERTERPEAAEAGASILVGYDGDRLVDVASRLLDDPSARAAIAQIENPYGDGRTAERIADQVVAYLSEKCEDMA